MKNTNNYEFDFEQKAIIITRSFYKAASVVGSDEYRELVTMRKDFADFSIKIKEIKKKENKVSYSGLSIAKMKAAISYITEKEDEVRQFEKYVEAYNGQKGKYATLKKLFLDKYKEKYNSMGAADMAEIDSLAKKYENAIATV